MEATLLRTLIFAHRRPTLVSALFPFSSNLAFRKRSAKILDKYFFLLLEELSVRNFIECGAHEANASKTFVAFGETALAVEANPLTFKEKTALAASAAIKTVNVGLAERAGVMDFYLPAKDHKAGNATFKPKKDAEYVTQQVEVVTLDALAQRHFPEKAPTALWVDVEGFAKEVLMGGRELLSQPQCLALKVEVETRPHFENQSLCGAVDDFLNDLGFVAVFVDHEFDTQFNIVYLKKTHLDAAALVIEQAIRDLGAIRENMINIFKYLRVKKDLKAHFASRQGGGV